MNFQKRWQRGWESKKPAVLVVHPEGNFWNNPQLSALLEILLEDGVKVDIIAGKRNFIQDPLGPEMRVRVLSQARLRLLLQLSRRGLMWSRFFVTPSAIFASRRARLVLAIDSDGLRIAVHPRRRRANVVFLSYELFFREEVGLRAKASELRAMRSVVWAAAADEVRRSELAQENSFPSERIVTAPVAHRPQDVEAVLAARERSAECTRYVLHSGSLDSWTRLEEVVETVDVWPDGWKLLVHGRYGITKRMRARFESTDRIELSTTPVKTNSDLLPVTARADIGLALYREIRGPYAGRNIRNVGLASGKAMTYLRYGTAVITTDRGPLGELVEAAGIGRMIVTPDALPDVLRGWTWTQADARRAIEVYNSDLATGRSECRLVAQVRESLAVEMRVSRPRGLALAENSIWR